jgi:hypothetical protein
MASAEMSLFELKDRYESDLNVRFTDEYLEVKLADAIALIAGEHPTVATRLASGVLLEANYKRVVADTVFRVIRNPGGFASEGEGGVSYQLRAAVASGEMWLTDRDIKTLTGRMPSDKTKAAPGSVSLGIEKGWA